MASWFILIYDPMLYTKMDSEIQTNSSSDFFEPFSKGCLEP